MTAGADWTQRSLLRTRNLGAAIAERHLLIWWLVLCGCAGQVSGASLRIKSIIFNPSRDSWKPPRKSTRPNKECQRGRGRTNALSPYLSPRVCVCVRLELAQGQASERVVQARSCDSLNQSSSSHVAP